MIEAALHCGVRWKAERTPRKLISVAFFILAFLFLRPMV
jgi:hypothetical protein